MKLDRLETHDRFLHFVKQSDYISKGCEDCIRNRPSEFGNHPFYIFAHNRTIGLDERISLYNDDFMRSMVDTTYPRQYRELEEVPTSRFIWIPRLSKPVPQSNSMLFKAYPPGDNVKIVWMIPAKELWGQYNRGNITENSIVSQSIHKLINDPHSLAEREEDDLPEHKIDAIYAEISRNSAGYKVIPTDNLLLKQASSEASIVPSSKQD